MKSNGLRLALAGLIVGIVLGFLLVNYLKHSLVEYLDEQIKRSCSCHLEVDKVELSLTTLSASARNARIVSEGETKLSFNRVSARANLWGIFERTINLRIGLSRGHAQGVDEDSATFKFIDFLSTPSANDSGGHKRWKIRLDRLDLKDSTFIEELPGGTFGGEGLALVMRRDDRDDFILDPSAKSIFFITTKEKGERKYPLGKLSGDMRIDDRFVYFDAAHLERDGLDVSAIAKVDVDNHSELSGDLKFDIDSRVLGLENDVDTRVKGALKLAGTFGSPQGSGSLLSPPDSISTVKLPLRGAALHFSNIVADINAGYEHSDLWFRLDALQAQSSEANLKITAPLGVRMGKIEGAATLQATSIKAENSSVEDLDLALKLGGDVTAPELLAKGSLGFLALETLQAGPLLFEAKRSGSKLNFNVNHDTPERGSVALTSQIRIENGEPSYVDELNFEIQALDVVASASAYSTLTLDASGKLSGPAALASLSGKSSFRLGIGALRDSNALQGNAVLESGSVELEFKDQENFVRGNAALSMLPGASNFVNLTLNKFPIDRFDPDINCILVDGSLSYHFALDAWLAGNGKIDLRGGELGCAPYTLLAAPSTLNINAGKAQGNIIIKNGESSLQLRGSAGILAGYDLKVDGSLRAESLLPVLSSLDDVGGALNAELQVSGDLSTPLIDGKALVTGGEFSLASQNLSAENISGELIFKNDHIDVGSLVGTLNGGEAKLQGSIFPFNLANSNAQLSFTGVELTPAVNTSMVIGGDVKLASSASTHALLSGAVQIESGEFEKAFDLKAALGLLSEVLFSKNTAPETRSESTDATLNMIELDLKIASERNLLLLTNWVSAELGANFSATGTLAAPLIRGEMELLSGWFGVKDRRFSITSGNLIFKPDSPEPTLDLLAETNVRTLYGDNVLIFLDAKGPLSSPAIRLNSDREYSERELLSLVTSNYGVSTDLSVPSLLLSPQERASATEDESIFSRIRFAFDRLTKIDEVSLEPSYNEQTGAVDPKVVATKELVEGLNLIGEQTFRTDIRKSELKLKLGLSPKSALVGRITSETNQERTALGVDLSYAVLPENEEFLVLTMDGANTLRRVEVLRALRIDSATRIMPDEFEKLGERLVQRYRELGYYNTQVELTCAEIKVFCRSGIITVHEGKPSKISKLSFEGDDLLPIIGDHKFIEKNVGLRASEMRRDKVSKDLTRKLRSEGYVGARVSVRYESLQESRDKEMRLSVSVGKPITFVFTGNNHFKPEELLATIDIFDRKLPFGRNTITILVENIELLYRKAGYLYATIQYAEESQNDGRVVYNVAIEEGSIIPVSAVRFNGGEALPIESLRGKIYSFDELAFNQIFTPSYAVAEEIEYNLRTIRQIFNEQGFPDVQVSYELIPDAAATGVEIVYSIEQGEALLTDWVEIANTPSDVKLPEPPFAPYSVPKANRYIENVIDTLQGNGFFSAAVNSSFDADSSKLRYVIDSGPQTQVSAVSVSGNDAIAEETILRYLALKVGEPWNRRKIEISRTTLLRLGLFSKVELVATDGELDSASEGLTVKVIERNLRSLEVGAGADSEYGMHLFGLATTKNLFRDGRGFELRLDGFYDPTINDITKGVASTRYSDPHIFGTDMRLTEDLRFQKLENAHQEFDLRRISLASYVDQQFNEDLELTLGHTLLFDDLSNVEPDVILGPLDQGSVRLSFLSGNILYDKRDYVLNPSEGYLASFDYKLVSEVLGSEGNFGTLVGRFSYIEPLGSEHHLTLATNTKLGSSWAFGGDDQVPITQRFYLGGLNSVRGFRENSLGPRGAEGHVIGGDLLFSNNLELRYRFAQGFALHTFFDAGTVFLRDESVDVADIRTSAGLGFRYLSPIGPVGFDVGHPLDEKEGEPSVRFHFTLGTTF